MEKMCFSISQCVQELNLLLPHTYKDFLRLGLRSGASTWWSTYPWHRKMLKWPPSSSRRMRVLALSFQLLRKKKINGNQQMDYKTSYHQPLNIAEFFTLFLKRLNNILKRIYKIHILRIKAFIAVPEGFSMPYST